MTAPTQAHIDALARALIPTLERAADKADPPETPKPVRDQTPRCELCNRPGRLALVILAHDTTTHPPTPAETVRVLLCRPHRAALEAACAYPPRTARLKARTVYAVNPERNT